MVHVRLKIKVGQVAPTPAIASGLGQRGVNIMKFLQKFNSLADRYEPNVVVIVLAQILQNKDVNITIKGRPSADLLKEEIGLVEGSSEAGKVQVGTLSMDQVVKVAKIKVRDFHNKGMNGVVSMLIGTARSIGIKVVDDANFC